MTTIATKATQSTWSSSKRREPNLEGAQELVSEALRVARETGLRATVARTIEGQRAIVSTLIELQQELPSPPTIDEARRMVNVATEARRGGESVGVSAARAIMEWIEERPETLETLGPRFLRKLFERLGATYIKLAQFIASSPTLFPSAYVKELEKLLDSAPPVSFDKIRDIIQAELGNSIESIFDYFDPEPLASASIAQVHAAIYKGEDVVVKVRKPGVDLLLKADLGFIEIAGKALEFIAPELGRLAVADILQDLRTTMLDELDFFKEAKNLQEYRAWLDSAGFLENIADCPIPYTEVSGKQVLVMTRLRGVPITSLIERRSTASTTSLGETTLVLPTAEEYLVNAINVWSASVLTCSFFHADVHGGNLIALDDGRIGFIDFGIVGRVPVEIWDAVANAAQAAVVRDYLGLAAALRDIGAADLEVNLDSFAADLQEVFKAFDKINVNIVVETSSSDPEAVAARLALDDTQVADVLISLVNASEKNGIKLPREFGLLVKQVLYFDRFQKILAPDLDVFEDERISLRDTSFKSTTSSLSRQGQLPPPSASY
eukprot:CAMPEP_0197291122 /NCGR_PEP_ID=MMETSP0890-20130614/11678_1 /TAXON_ID=44058 ORGANISM="Aureoumbra lagunensis, Strain CCMP1510" /NCGR_SAMPLE_ID=MMETSP0890 /ASSEMBLY_ACC=CAM_ASM_000533 /LENGTH=550 /DNA_ID=CAMNT_0042763711 /DNA_START=74 /DNA_END=1726 /DNA_ORIENTATION=+